MNEFQRAKKSLLRLHNGHFRRFPRVFFALPCVRVMFVLWRNRREIGEKKEGEKAVRTMEFMHHVRQLWPFPLLNSESHLFLAVTAVVLSLRIL